ncbi:MAG: hypothetical protein ACRD1G_08525, partial [Acidimicrobiales bacterium]
MIPPLGLSPKTEPSTEYVEVPDCAIVVSALTEHRKQGVAFPVGSVPSSGPALEEMSGGTAPNSHASFEIVTICELT